LGGYRLVSISAIPAKQGADPEPYSLRLATFDDISDIMALYNQPRRASLVWHEAPAAYWRHFIGAWDDPVVRERGATQIGLTTRLYMIVDGAGRTCGFIRLAAKRWGRGLEVYTLQLAPQVNWQAAMPCLLRAIHQHGSETPTPKPATEPFSEILFGLGRTHPVYEVLGETLAPRGEPPYAWYLRVADLPAFVQHVAPVLEDRLANSILTGHTGELKFDCYRGGLRLQLEQGKLVAVEPWRAPTYGDNAQAGCPSLVFLQLLFGYRSLAELRATFPDVWADEAAALLIDTLFPKQPSTVYSLSST
jgi:hypothetical protein